MVFWEGLVVICIWQSYQAVLPGIGMYLDVGLEGRLRLSCGQHSFKSLLSLILPYFASPLLQTHFCGKSSFGAAGSEPVSHLSSHSSSPCRRE